MRAIINIIFIIGIICITVGYMQNYTNCLPPKIEYRYVPRTFFEEQTTNVNLRKLYSDMFNESSTWSTYPFNDRITEYNTSNYSNFVENVSNEGRND